MTQNINTMDKVIKTINSEIGRLKESIEKDKSIITGSLDDVNAYANALKVIGPKLKSLENLDKVLEFINHLNDSQAEPKPASKRGRPKKVK